MLIASISCRIVITSFAQVPEKLKEQVREILIDLECPELAE